MFDRADFDVILHEHSTSLGVSHIISRALNEGMSFDIDTLNLIAKVLFCRQKNGMNELSCMQPFSFDTERFFQSNLLLHFFIVFSLLLLVFSFGTR